MKPLILLLLLCGQAFAQDDDLPIVEPPALTAPLPKPWPGEAEGDRVTVELLVALDETGAIEELEVLTSAGEPWDSLALDALQQARFRPARTNEGPVGVAFPFTFVFERPAEAGDGNDASNAAPDAAQGADAPESEPTAEPGDDDIIEGPRILEYIEAPYPPDAEAQGIEAEVRLLVTLDEAGEIEEVELLAPVGDGFDEAALDAVRQMRFSPALTPAGPVGVAFEFIYAFTLTDDPEAEAAPPPVNLTGRLRQMGTRKPVEGATIVLEGADLSTTSDEEGRFELAGAPSGDAKLRVLHPEHVTLTEDVSITEGERTDVDLWLRAMSYRDNEAVGYYERERTEVTRHTLNIEDVKRIPGTFGDPVKVIQTLPGAARSPFGTGLLIIRGSNPEDSAVYVDGIRLPIIFHLTGTTSVLQPDVVEAVDYLPGGYGVQYGRSMGGVVDIRTKERITEDKLVWGTDILDTQLYYQGNVGKKKGTGIVAGARRSYIDAFIPLFTRNLDFSIRPVYWDYQLKLMPTLGDGKNKLNFFLYGTYDSIRVATPPDVAQGSDPATQGDLRTVYQSHRLVASYTHTFSDALSFKFQPSIGVDLLRFGLGQEFGLDSTNLIPQIRAELPWQATDWLEVTPGLDFIGGPYAFNFRSAVSFADLDDPLAERTPVGFDGRGWAFSPDPWLRFSIRPLKDRSRWLITPGVRGNFVTYTFAGGITLGQQLQPSTTMSVDPRLATRFRIYGDDEKSGTLKASSGLYHQPPQPFQSFGIGTSARMLAQRSFNSSIGFEQRISRAFRWDVDVFYRWMDDLVAFNSEFSGAFTQPFTNSGQGRVGGFELILRHDRTGRFFGWISYTFSRSFRRDNEDAPWFPFDFDQPHIFSAQGGVDLPFDIGISLQIQAVSGNPDTRFNAGIYDVDGNFYNAFRIGAGNAERLPPFVQTSFRIDRRWTFRKWQLDTYLDLINAIRGINPEATVYNYDYSQAALVRGLPFIPNLGFEVRFTP